MPRSLPAPKSFRTATGVRWAKFCERPSFIKEHRATGARGRGLKYEAKVHAKLQQVYAGLDCMLLISPWIEFCDDSGRRWCQPDAVALDNNGKCGIVYEIKYNHTSDAWFQLWRLYTPVLEAMFRECSFGCMEVCKWLDPSVAWPEPPSLAPSLLVVPDPRRTAIHVWNPQREI